MAETENAKVVEIREFYNDFVPPRYVRKLVARLLSAVQEKYLRGLDCVVLTNQSGMPRRDRIGKLTSRKRRVSQSGMLGRYHHAYRGKPPWIELFVDNLSAGIAPHPLIPFLREACFGYVLFHEIGHHIDATLRPEFREKEDVADGWGRKLLHTYFRQRYRFPRPVAKVVSWLFKALLQELRC